VIGRVVVGETFFLLAPVPNDAEREAFEFLGLVHRAAGTPVDAEFENSGFWDLRVSIANDYQVGRGFIAGDAARSHPPVGGFGLNNGLEDIRNLDWKMAACLQGWGGDALLASYSEERRPIFWEVGEDFIARGMEREGAFLARYSPDRDKARARAGVERVRPIRWRPCPRLRAALRSLLSGSWTVGRSVQRARAVQLQSPTGPPPVAPAALGRTVLAGGAWTWLHATCL
jgi:hypothetical protein